MEFNEKEFWDKYRDLGYGLSPLLSGFGIEAECEWCDAEFWVDSWNPMNDVSISPEEWLDTKVEEIVEDYLAGKPTKHAIDELMKTLRGCCHEICIDDYCPECDESMQLSLADCYWSVDVEPAIEKLEKILPAREEV